MKNNKGFTLVEILVAVLIFSIITIPIMLTFYMGAIQVERQTGETKEVNIARETLTLIINDLQKYATLATRVETQDNITKLIIRDDENLTKDPKKVIYIYDSGSKVLIRMIDDLQSVILSEEQLGNRYYKEEQAEKYNIYENEPVKIEKDNLSNTISVYLRIKTDQEAKPQEDFYQYRLVEEDRKVIKFEQNGYIEDLESFNFRDSSFTIETYFKLGNINTLVLDDRCLFNLVDGNSNSKIKIKTNSNKIHLLMDNESVGNIELGQDTTGVWRKLVITYDDNKKEIKMYISKKDDPSNLECKSTIYYDTDAIFYKKTNGPIYIDKVYIGNEQNSNNNNFSGPLYMYEPRIWQKTIDITKEDLTKRLIGNEDSLIFYIKDDYKKVFLENKVVFNVINAVTNNVMNFKYIEVDEEIPTEKTDTAWKTNFDNISKLIGY